MKLGGNDSDIANKEQGAGDEGGDAREQGGEEEEGAELEDRSSEGGSERG